MKLILSVPLLLSLLSMVARGRTDSGWIEQARIKLPSAASSLTYSADGSRIAVGHSGGTVTIWNPKSGELIRSLEAHTKEVNSVQFIFGDTKLLTVGDDHRARLWAVSDWSEAGVIEGAAFSGGVSPDGRWFAAQNPNQAIWIWDLTTLQPVKQLTEPGKGGTQMIGFTADGRFIATAAQRPLLINIETKQAVAFVSSTDKKTEVKIQQQGNQVGISLGAMQDDDAPTHRLIPSRTGSLVALGRGWYGQPTFVDVWDISTMKRLGRFKAKDTGILPSFSFDNTLLAVDGAKSVTIWRVATAKQISSVKGDGLIQFSPHSHELAVTDGNDLIIYQTKQ